MNRPTPYNVDAAWIDPSERKSELRVSSRSKSRFLITIKVRHEPTGKNLVGPGKVFDISGDGVLVVTKHELRQGQPVSLAISTEFCAESLGLPAEFTGPGHVVRVSEIEDRRSLVAIRFAQPLRDNLEFAAFIEYARSLGDVMTA